MSTTLVKKEAVKPNWWVVDATDQVVGRLAVKIATILRGKHRPDYTPSVDTGDFVVVINCEKVKFTGRKWDQQEYATYSQYPGGLKIVTAKEYLQRKPEFILQTAIKRMMPKNRLAKHQFTKLKIYKGNSHPHQAQNPQPLKTSAR